MTTSVPSGRATQARAITPDACDGSTPAGPPLKDACVSNTDEHLIRRVASGDQAAFRMLAERHADRAFGLALRFLKNRADADDVVQDCFLKIWTHPEQWQPERGQFTTWFHRVVVNRCIDMRRTLSAVNIDDIEEPIDASCNAFDRIQEQESLQQLNSAVDALPRQQRIAIILSYRENMSNSDIAKTMNTTVMAVESLLKRGRQHLRDVLRRTSDGLQQLLER